MLTWLLALNLLTTPAPLAPPAAAPENRPLGAHGHTKAPLPPRELGLTVASYNAWLLPLASTDLRERTEAMGPALAAISADVICLQEVWDEKAANAVRISLIERLPYGIIAGGGLTTLSRWPILATRFVPYAQHPAMSLLERFAKKGYLVTVLATPLGPVQVVNTHMIWEGRRAPQQSLAERAHWAQVKELTDAVRHTVEYPTIVCGDFNHRAVDGDMPTDEFMAWLDVGFTDAAGTAAASDGRWAPRARTRYGYPRGPNVAPRGSDPDYILMRSGAKVNVSAVAFRHSLNTPETALSDHDLLIAELRLTRP
jgi:endonuclease/exonuclease/phosphatase family metal-dependent hydrolase